MTAPAPDLWGGPFGTTLPNVLYVRVLRGDGSEHDHETLGGVYVWPDRSLVTLYPTTDVNEGIIVPIHRIVLMRFGKPKGETDAGSGT